jgi:hypothetical protein
LYLIAIYLYPENRWRRQKTSPYSATMENTKKGAKPTLGRSIQGAALIVQAPARIAGSSRRLSTTGRDADIAEVHARLDRIANDLAALKRDNDLAALKRDNDLAALKRDVVDLKNRSRRPRRKGRLDGNQLELPLDTWSAEQPVNVGKPDEKDHP